MKQIILSAIRFYQRYLSFDTGVLRYLFLSPSASKGGRRYCRHTPRCSEYTYQAVSRYGIINGLRLGMRRIVSCHPWASGGYDPVPEVPGTVKRKSVNRKIRL